MHVLSPGSRRRKHSIIIVLILGSIFILILHLYSDIRAHVYAIRMGKWPWMGPVILRTRPPTYDRIIQMERDLPQHNLSLPYPEGRNGRYVKFSYEVPPLGWNNVFTEILLCSHLAWRAKRAYVFQDYLWAINHYPWLTHTQPRTPINAFIAGPTAGGSWSEGDDTPRSVSAEWFDVVCPPEDTDIIDTAVAKKPVNGVDGQYVMEHWVRLLNESPKRCVNVVGIADFGKNHQVEAFDLWLVSKPLILTLWPEFRDSPVSKLLRASPLVTSAIERNEHLFFSHLTTSYTNPYVGMMAIHIRRGDYVRACQNYATWSSTFYAWNLLPHLPDAFTPPPTPEGTYGTNTPENYAIYRRRCFPTQTQVLKKIQEAKSDWETHPASKGQKLHSLYIMTNANSKWINGLKDQLLAEGWLTVLSSADIILDSEQTSVSMAIDTEIGRKAAVFIGNGWSSMSSVIVHRRLAEETDPASIRFW